MSLREGYHRFFEAFYAGDYLEISATKGSSIARLFFHPTIADRVDLE
jgi:hypothetical protein